MTEDPAPILSVAEAKKRFFLYLVLKLSGLGAMFGGVFLSRDGISALPIILLLAGAATLFLRPRHLGLTTRAER